MRREDWLQRVLYLIMAALAIYIIFKGGSVLLSGKSVQNALENGTLQRPIEDAAVSTYMPGYAAAVKERKEEWTIAGLLKPVVPVYSYLTENQEGTETEIPENSSDFSKANTLETVSDTPERDVLENVSDASETGVLENVSEGLETGTSEKIVSETGSGLKEENISENEKEVQKVNARVIAPTLSGKYRDFNYLISNYYTVDAGTTADEELFRVESFLGTDLSLVQKSDVPQILIYHTHSQEAFADSREGEVEDTVVGMGEVLAEHLRKYGYHVIHDTGVYDLVDGVLDRSAAYDYAREAVDQILAENPTIEVIIDLHRDGVEGTKFVTEIGGKPASMIMFFNGISRNSQNEVLSWLPNEYLKENLAFSFQLQLLAEEWYPGFTRNIYLKAERFNLHLRPRSLLIEAGTQLNTVEEERNAMEPLAKLLHQVLSGVVFDLEES